MQQKINRIFWIWDFDKEQKWLDEMSAKGLTLVSVGFCTYNFEDTDNGEYSVRLEMLGHFPSHPKSKEYISFVEETGAEYLGSVKKWVYFRKKKSEGDFELHSDYKLRIKHINLILYLTTSIIAILSLYAIALVYHIFSESDYRLILSGLPSLGLLLYSVLGRIRLSRMKKQLIKEHRLYE